MSVFNQEMISNHRHRYPLIRITFLVVKVLIQAHHVVRSLTTGQALDSSSGGINRRENRYSTLSRCTPDMETVLKG